MVKHGKLDFGYNMTIIESIMYGDLGDLKLRDRDLVTLKPIKKTAIFVLKIY